MIRRAPKMLGMPSAGRPTHLVPTARHPGGAACMPSPGLVDQGWAASHAAPQTQPVDLLTAIASNLCVYAIAGAGRHLQAGCRALLSMQSRSEKHGVSNSNCWAEAQPSRPLVATQASKE